MPQRVTADAFRRRLGDYLEDVFRARRRFVITKHGSARAMLIPCGEAYNPKYQIILGDRLYTAETFPELVAGINEDPPASNLTAYREDGQLIIATSRGEGQGTSRSYYSKDDCRGPR